VGRRCNPGSDPGGALVAGRGRLRPEEHPGGKAALVGRGEFGACLQLSWRQIHPIPAGSALPGPASAQRRPQRRVVEVEEIQQRLVHAC
jgi:hypothetical protein